MQNLRYLGLFMVVTLLLALPMSALAQSGYFRQNNDFHLGVGVGNNAFNGSLAWNHWHRVAFKGRFRLGYGLRFTAYGGRNQDFITAPARLTSRRQDPLVLFSETFEENLDTLRLPQAQVNSLNSTLR